MVQKLSKAGLFSVKSGLMSWRQGKDATSFTNRIFWNQWVPSKVLFYAWEAWWGRVMTMDQLNGGAPLLVGALHVGRMKKTWAFVYTVPWSGILGPPSWQPCKLPGCLLCLPKIWLLAGKEFLLERKKERFGGLPPLSVLDNQKGRNRMVFENVEFYLNRLKRTFVFSLFSWASLVVIWFFCF